MIHSLKTITFSISIILKDGLSPFVECKRNVNKAYGLFQGTDTVCQGLELQQFFDALLVISTRLYLHFARVVHN